MMRCTIALIAVLVLGFFAADAQAALSFSIHGDWGIPIDWADTLAKCSEKHESKFILAIGDNFYGRLTHGYHGVKSTTDTKWKTIFEDIYTHKFFKHPWYVIAGNHDHEESVRAQINYESKSSRWNFPKRYYVVPKKVGNSKLDIFMIDTTPISASDEFLKKKYGFKGFDMAQVRWLKGALQKSNAKWKIVVGHHPIFKAQKGGNKKLQRYIVPLLNTYKVAAYIGGHTHNMQHVKTSKLHYLTVGNGAIQVAVKSPTKVKGVKQLFMFPTADTFATRCAAGACRGFAVMTVHSANKMTVHYYDATGRKLKSIDINNPN